MLEHIVCVCIDSLRTRLGKVKMIANPNPQTIFSHFKHIPNIEDCHVFMLCCVVTRHVVSVKLSINVSPRKGKILILELATMFKGCTCICFRWFCFVKENHIIHISLTMFPTQR